MTPSGAKETTENEAASSAAETEFSFEQENPTNEERINSE